MRTLPLLRIRQISHRTLKRLGIALLIVLLLHLVFLFFVAPHISWNPEIHSRTEVVEINPQELKLLKQQIKAALMKEELREEYRTKEAPKDAQMIGAFNQKVPEQMTADSKGDDPSYGGGGAKSRPVAPPSNVKLSNLGLGSRIPKPQTQTQEPSPMQGAPGPYRPRGLEDKKIKKGNQNLLDAVESEYYSFFVRFEEPIVRNWYFLMRSYAAQITQELNQNKRRQGEDIHVILEFIIDRSGNFRSIDIIQPSGIPTIDNVIRESVKKLGSIPNPPPAIFEGEPYFTRQLGFVIHLSESSFVNTRPDIGW